MKNTVLPNKVPIVEINAHETKFLYREIFIHRYYMSHGIEIQDGAVIIDAGANIGMFDLYLLMEFNPSKIYCFEPAPHCLEALRANLAKWGDRAVIIDSALGDREGEVEFTFYPGCSIMSGIFADKDRDLDFLKLTVKSDFDRRIKADVKERMVNAYVGEKLENAVSFKCPITTISAIIEKYDIESVDLLKIDVERAETAIVHGISDAHWGRIKQVVVEVHDQGAREHESMRDLLARKGFKTYMSVEEDFENAAVYALTARRD